MHSAGSGTTGLPVPPCTVPRGQGHIKVRKSPALLARDRQIPSSAAEGRDCRLSSASSNRSVTLTEPTERLPPLSCQAPSLPLCPISHPQKRQKTCLNGTKSSDPVHHNSKIPVPIPHYRKSVLYYMHTTQAVRSAACCSHTRSLTHSSNRCDPIPTLFLRKKSLIGIGIIGYSQHTISCQLLAA